MQSLTQRAPDGLVLCPKTRTSRFPGAEGVGAAAAGIRAASVVDPFGGFAGEVAAQIGLGEGPRWFVTVSPGSVRIGSVDLARGQRRQNRAVEYICEDWQRPDLAHGVPAHPTLAREWAFKAMNDAALNALIDGGLGSEDERPEPLGPGRHIVEWSAKSRVNMTRTLVTLDYNTLIAQGELAMLTLTYPGDWLPVVPNGRVFKHHIDKLRQRFRKRYGKAMAGVWKMEFQRRGAPHLHMLMPLPESMHDFRAWVRSAWAAIVDHPDAIERMKHEGQGANVDRPDRPMTDPKRIGVYFNKHGLWGSKEYQNRPPAEWVSAAEQGESVGRFWGYWQLERMEVPAMVTGDEAKQAARMLRRWQARSRYTRETVVQRIDTRTGVVRYRKVQRVVVRMPSTAGFLAVNDGPSVAFMVERLIRGMRGM